MKHLEIHANIYLIKDNIITFGIIVAKESGDYKTRIYLEFVNLNQSKFEILKEELRNAFSRILKVPKTSIVLTLKRVMVKRESSYSKDENDQDSIIVVLTIETNTEETAKAIVKIINLGTLVERVNDEISRSETLKNSGITLERVSTVITEGQNGR